MTFDYFPLAQWTSVIVFGVFFGLTTTFSGVFFYNKIMAKADQIKNKVRTDLKTKKDEFNQIVKQYSEQEFADQISRIVKFREIFDKSSIRFSGGIIGSAVAIILLNIIYILWISQRENIFLVGVLILLIHLFNWGILVRDHNRLEQFLEGRDPKVILG